MATKNHSAVAQANRLTDKLAKIEVDGSYAADLRKVMTDERLTLHIRRAKAMSRTATQDDVDSLSAACTEAERVMRMWSVW